MSFATGYVSLNSQPTNWGQTLSEFQVMECDGSPVGDPVIAMQAIVMNKLLAHICNLDDMAGVLAPAIGEAVATAISESAPAEYNNNWLDVLEDGETQNYSGVHELSFTVLSGTGTLSIDGNPAVPLAAGQSHTFKASSLIVNEFAFTCTTGKISIAAIY